LGRTARTGQPGQDSPDRTARTGKREQENWDRKFRKTEGIVHQDRKQRQNGQNMAARTGQLRQDNQDGTTTAVERRYLGQDIQLR
jgi:hypothetical protein